MSRGATARLFVAVELPLAVRERLATWARRVTELSWAGPGRRAMRALAPESLHLTLCFLGSRPVDEMAPLAAVVRSCEEHACELSVGAPLWLPARRPRALAVEVCDRGGGLGRVQARLSDALRRAGAWEPERRRFRAHITLVRIGRGAYATRGSRTSRASGGPPPLPATPGLDFAPEAIVLYRSWLHADGASYEPLVRNELAPVGR
ncbi:MAG: RNA 2',3'-cyclic phosphodiesterase [Solirubrobacteraceae bacterium]